MPLNPSQIILVHNEYESYIFYFESPSIFLNKIILKERLSYHSFYLNMEIAGKKMKSIYFLWGAAAEDAHRFDHEFGPIIEKITISFRQKKL